MAKVREKIYRPRSSNKKIYDQLFSEYNKLHDQFGRDSNSTMKVLKRLKNKAIGL
jgi:L-ribulokinase